MRKFILWATRVGGNLMIAEFILEQVRRERVGESSPNYLISVN